MYDTLLKTQDELEQFKRRLQLAGTSNTGEIGATIQRLGFKFADGNSSGTVLHDELDESFTRCHDHALSAKGELSSLERELETYRNFAMDESVSQAKKDGEAFLKAHQLEKWLEPLILRDTFQTECTICIDSLHNGQSFIYLETCKHRFHKRCIEDWLKEKHLCPICKATTRKSHINEICAESTMVGTGSVNIGFHSHPYSSSSSSSSSSSASFDKSIMHPDFRGNFGTKVDRLTSDLQFLMESNEDEKAIVFSQWPEMLDIVVQSLLMNEIPYVHIKDKLKDFAPGGRMSKFKDSPDLRVLVMPLGLGAEGLDIIVANHIFLLEPLLNAAQEAQAINRCDRIGQTRRVHIHKYVVRGTVEERIVVQQRLSSSSAVLAPVHATTSSPAGKRLTKKKTPAVPGGGDQKALAQADLRFILHHEVDHIA